MTQQTANSTDTQTDPLYTRIIAQLNEEKLAKDLTQVQLSRIKLLEEIATDLPSSSRGAEIRSMLEEHLKENASSLAARYVIGIQDLQEDRKTGIEYLGDLMQEFQRAARWPIVDHIADHVLQVDENHRTALRAKVESTERLRGKKELKPYLERLATIDKNNPDIARKYGMAILEEEPERAVEFLKMAAESYVRQRDYNNLEEIWQILVSKAYSDIPFFEKLERILAANREKTRIAAYLVGLVEPFRQEEDWDNVIHILKKILQYEPNSSRARSDLVRAYRARYENHSLLNEFLKMSDLTNNRKPVASAIANFERNIVFDTGNYVYHRTRGVGKITEIDSENVIIDFRDNPGQRMSLQMAISSLLPLEPSHIWVRYYENPEEMKNIFEEDPIEFFTILLSSYNKSITLAEIKSEIAGKFIDAGDWSKWWSRTRTRLKKDPNFGFNPRKKDELLLREKEVTLAEEQEEKFLHTADWNAKLELAMDTLKDPDTRASAETCSHFYLEQESNKDLTKRLHSFLFLEAAQEAFPDMELPRQITRDMVKAIFAEETEKALVKLSADTPVTEFKRSIVDLVIETRKEDYQQILSKILFELPIKVHRYVIGELNRLGQIDTLRAFVEKVFRKYRENPEIFLWVARSILSGQWTYPWIPANREEVILMVFRLLKPLVRIESKGTRLKNQAVESIFGT
ncbi:MAG: transcription elongation factor GreAB, partial [Leptospiraceae bacterium]|nr:transcription elongation factor GreAB [Leptospiraceae bacterium]